eukprot:CAMPEP_0177721376 /NCGR_PEP_ID=MMETSP0484_2-20121128/17112_1 /TAXON_ID=354590 /ORGANISM="Rhodomonas lens, Strain RHODO" /LENGTH=126 /DNA_ID=CAMNT_0019233673 /DNA_START=128 /DNA_END=505 /DNA_ORIENTATION=-
MSDNSTLDSSLNSSGEQRGYDIITSNGAGSLLGHERLRARLERGKQELAVLLAREVDSEDRGITEVDRELMRLRGELRGAGGRGGSWSSRQQGSIRMDEDEEESARMRSSALDPRLLSSRDREQSW